MALKLATDNGQISGAKHPRPRVGIIGATGRMGRAIAGLAGANGVAVGGGYDKNGSHGGSVPGVPMHRDLRGLASNCDVLVDFSVPLALSANLNAARLSGIPILIGTTGLNRTQENAIDEAAKHVPVMHAPCTSFGVNLLIHVIRSISARISNEWDVEIIEMHHRHKVDAPSGTAKRIGEAIASAHGLNLEEIAVEARVGMTGPRRTGTIGFSSVRGGSVAGDHTIIFATEGERLEFTHRAESRDVFAQGAIQAAKWLVERKPGRYTMENVLGFS